VISREKSASYGRGSRKARRFGIFPSEWRIVRILFTEYSLITYLCVILCDVWRRVLEVLENVSDFFLPASSV
jgi:hypothetical protein